jgi:ubiquinone/menaquinone biosynthesis C-methylase UbiE
VDQANTLTELLHGDTRYPAGARVLEAGCGVGAQTISLVANSPGARFTCVDLSAASLGAAKTRVTAAGYANAEFHHADLYHLPFADGSFDHGFVCFVLEHLPDPLAALHHLRTKLRPGGSLTVIEGDHGSAYFHPQSEEAQQTIRCLIELQARAGGNSLIGRELYPLLSAAGFRDVHVSPRMVYADANRPDLIEGFTKNTFTAMVEGVREPALRAGLMDEATWNKGIADMYRTAELDGTFCYTFFKAVALK